MKIEYKGYEITDVPGLESITIEPSEHSERGIRILIDDGRSEIPRSYGIAELETLIRGLEQALRLADIIAIQNGRTDG